MPLMFAKTIMHSLPMSSQNATILAVAPGRIFGLAVFTATELSYFSVHRLDHGAAEPSIPQMFASFDPQVIVVRVPSQYQKTSIVLGPMIKAIEREAVDKQISFVTITLAEIKSRLCDDRRATQIQAYLRLVQIYPELNRFLDRPSKWQIKYYQPLLAAVSAGVAYLEIARENPP